MRRCCAGETYVLPNGSPLSPSWAVICTGCDKILTVVDGDRDEVYADL